MSQSDLDDRIELFILKGLLSYQDYAAKYIDKLDSSLFSPDMVPVISIIKKFYAKYQKSPNVAILMDNYIPKYMKGDVSKIEKCEEIIQNSLALDFSKDSFYEFLVDETRNFVKYKGVQNALVASVTLFQENKIDEAVKKLLEATNVSFDDDLGLDYFEDLDERMRRMRSSENVMPTGLDKLNKEIGGGWHKKSLVIFGAGTNVGKTLILGDIAFKLIEQGYNGLYVTLEIHQDLLANRIDSNLTDISMGELNSNIDVLYDSIKKRKEEPGSKFGRLIIKEYAPNCLSCNQLKSYVRELNLKKNGFKPDFIAVDYIALLSPNGKTFSDNTYGKLKTVAEELRTLASELNIPVFSASQINREGMTSSHVGLENVSDSMGIPMTADLMIMITRDEDLDNENKMRWFIAKNRYSRNGATLMFTVDYNYMRIQDDEQVAKVNRISGSSKAMNHQSMMTIKKTDNNTAGKNDEGDEETTDEKGVDHGQQEQSVKKTLNI